MMAHHLSNIGPVHHVDLLETACIKRFCTQGKPSICYCLLKVLNYKPEGGNDISEKEVYTSFTSEQIQPFNSAMAGRDGTPVKKY